MRSEPGGGPAAPQGDAPAPAAGGGWGRPRRLHPLSPVFFAAREARRLWPIVLLVFARRQLWLLVLAAAVLAAVVVLEWLRRTYTLGDAAMRIEEGVLARRRRLLPFDRIQQVDLVRKPLHRLLGVATLRVETAGGSGGSQAALAVFGWVFQEVPRSFIDRLTSRIDPEALAPSTAPALLLAGVLVIVVLL